MLEPNAIIFYVDNIEASSCYYQKSLGIKPQEKSSTFHMFKLSNGMGLGLKAKELVQPELKGDSSAKMELAFIVKDNVEVENIFTDWQNKKIEILQQPTNFPFGYGFVALDIDGNRLRVVSLAIAQ